MGPPNCESISIGVARGNPPALGDIMVRYRFEQSSSRRDENQGSFFGILESSCPLEMVFSASLRYIRKWEKLCRANEIPPTETRMFRLFIMVKVVVDAVVEQS